jgi:hypothetical protein
VTGLVSTDVEAGLITGVLGRTLPPGSMPLYKLVSDDDDVIATILEAPTASDIGGDTVSGVSFVSVAPLSELVQSTPGIN